MFERKTGNTVKTISVGTGQALALAARGEANVTLAHVPELEKKYEDFNDAPQETDAMTRWIVDHLGPDVPVHFTAFHPDWKLQDRPPTPAANSHRRARHRPG